MPKTQIVSTPMHQWANNKQLSLLEALAHSVETVSPPQIKKEAPKEN